MTRAADCPPPPQAAFLPAPPPSGPLSAGVWGVVSKRGPVPRPTLGALAPATDHRLAAVGKDEHVLHIIPRNPSYLAHILKICQKNTHTHSTKNYFGAHDIFMCLLPMLSNMFVGRAGVGYRRVVRPLISKQYLVASSSAPLARGCGPHGFPFEDTAGHHTTAIHAVRFSATGDLLASASTATVIHKLTRPPPPPPPGPTPPLGSHPPRPHLSEGISNRRAFAAAVEVWDAVADRVSPRLENGRPPL